MTQNGFYQIISSVCGQSAGGFLCFKTLEAFYTTSTNLLLSFYVGFYKACLVCSLALDDPTVQGLDKSRHLQTGEMIIIVVVLVMWAGKAP